MDPKPPPIEYRTARPDERERPRLWLSHMGTAAMLCLFSLMVDKLLRYDADAGGKVGLIEGALAIYGLTCAIVSRVRGGLTKADEFAVVVCLVLFSLTAYVGLIMPRAIR